MTDDELRERFSLNYERLSAGLTPTELARRIEAVPAVIIRACKGRTIPRLNTAIRIADGLGVGICELIKKPSDPGEKSEGSIPQRRRSSATSES